MSFIHEFSIPNFTADFLSRRGKLLWISREFFRDKRKRVFRNLDEYFYLENILFLEKEAFEQSECYDKLRTCFTIRC